MVRTPRPRGMRPTGATARRGFPAVVATMRRWWAPVRWPTVRPRRPMAVVGSARRRSRRANSPSRCRSPSRRVPRRPPAPSRATGWGVPPWGPVPGRTRRRSWAVLRGMRAATPRCRASAPPTATPPAPATRGWATVRTPRPRGTRPIGTTARMAPPVAGTAVLVMPRWWAAGRWPKARRVVGSDRPRSRRAIRPNRWRPRERARRSPPAPRCATGWGAPPWGPAPEPVLTTATPPTVLGRGWATGRPSRRGGGLVRRVSASKRGASVAVSPVTPWMVGRVMGRAMALKAPPMHPAEAASIAASMEVPRPPPPSPRSRRRSRRRRERASPGA